MGPIGRVRSCNLATLRRDIAHSAGYPVVLSTDADPKTIAFARASNVREISQRGPATPDHILRTKRLPMLGRDVEAYASSYREYFARNAPRARRKRRRCSIPRRGSILDAEFGMATVGRSAKEAGIARDLYSHTIDVIARAEALGGYRALSEEELFEFEYWDFEQAKLRRAGAPPVFAGEIAWVTGAASGIGKACVEALLKRGRGRRRARCRSPGNRRCGPARLSWFALATLLQRKQSAPRWKRAVRAFGGMDMLILNAGVFPAGAPIESLESLGMAPGLRGERRCESGFDARMLSAAEAGAARRTRRRHRIEERRCSRARERRRIRRRKRRSRSWRAWPLWSGAAPAFA